jgi:hypothetical protein
MSLSFRLIAVEFTGSHKRSMNRKPANMGIAGVEPRHCYITYIWETKWYSNFFINFGSQNVDDYIYLSGQLK